MVDTIKRTVPRLGAYLDGDHVVVRVWAPDRTRASVTFYREDGHTKRATFPLVQEPGGFFSARIPAPPAPLYYRIAVDKQPPYPDPLSRSQPLGVHGPSEIVDLGFAWSDQNWKGIPLADLVLYEVHVGAATPEGTFEALIPRLPYLRELGVTAIELMPVASFPGRWNWGYDGVALFAPQAVYGGPRGLARLVDAAHAAGLGIFLDVVYNHLGPDGNYLEALSCRYRSPRHHSLWGSALDLDSEGCEPVRELCLSNVEMWIRDYHFDGLRLDATDALFDDHDPHILLEIGERAKVAGIGRTVLVIAEDDRNEARVVRPIERGGYGLDAAWAGDLHNATRAAITGDDEGYFADYQGITSEIATALEKGWIFEGQPSLRTKGRPRGTPAAEVPPPAIVQYIQNHDQIGNRAQGDRLGAAVDPSVYRALSALFLMAPYTPLLFMGQEFCSTTPFQFFTDHHPELGRKVTEGRRREYEAFASFHGEVPDPQDPATFERSKLRWSEGDEPMNRACLELYRELLRLRRTLPCLRNRDRTSFSARALGAFTMLLERCAPSESLLVVMNRKGPLVTSVGPGYSVLLSTEEERFSGSGVLPSLCDGTLRHEGPITVLLVRNTA